MKDKAKLHAVAEAVKYDEDENKVHLKSSRKVKKTHAESNLDLLIEQNIARRRAGLDEIEIGRERACTKCNKVFVSLRGERQCGCVKSRHASTLNGQAMI